MARRPRREPDYADADTPPDHLTRLAARCRVALEQDGEIGPLLGELDVMVYLVDPARKRTGVGFWPRGSRPQSEADRLALLGGYLAGTIAAMLRGAPDEARLRLRKLLRELADRGTH